MAGKYKTHANNMRIRWPKQLDAEMDGQTITEELLAKELAEGKALLVDQSKILSWRDHTFIPEYYRDQPFKCRDCGATETWTAAQQKWWFEEAGGEIESTAIRCRACREKERLRREEARKVHQDGLRKKRAKPGGGGGMPAAS